MSWEQRVAERDRTCIGAIAVDRDLKIVDVTAGVLEQSGLERDVLIGRKAVDLVHPDDERRATDVLEEVRSIPGERPDGLYRLRHADGLFGYYTVRATNLGEAEDDVIVLEFREPTDQIRAQAFADDAVDVMRIFSEDLTLDESLDLVATVAERHVEGLQIVFTLFESSGPNRVFSRGEVPESILRFNLTAEPDALPVHVEVAYNEFVSGPWRASQKIASLDFIQPGRLTSVLVGRTGAIVGYVEALRATVEAPDEAEWLVHGMISRMMTAVLHRHEFDRQLRRAADLDPLTGLLNRRKLFEVLDADENFAGSLLYLIDLDRFSWVNNNLGHQAGDETIVGVAHALIHACPERSLIARLGGDEFVVWIPADQAHHDLAVLGETIRQAMVVPAGEGDQRVWVRASTGMVRVVAGESAADAINRADVAMYASKRSGGDSTTAG